MLVEEALSKVYLFNNKNKLDQVVKKHPDIEFKIFGKTIALQEAGSYLQTADIDFLLIQKPQSKGKKILDATIKNIEQELSNILTKKEIKVNSLYTLRGFFKDNRDIKVIFKAAKKMEAIYTDGEKQLHFYQEIISTIEGAKFDLSKINKIKFKTSSRTQKRSLLKLAKTYLKYQLGWWRRPIEPYMLQQEAFGNMDKKVQKFLEFTSRFDLCQAASNSIGEIGEILDFVDKASVLNTKDEQYDTIPLHQAVVNRHMENANLLLDYDADPTVTNNCKESAFDVAMVFLFDNMEEKKYEQFIRRLANHAKAPAWFQKKVKLKLNGDDSFIEDLLQGKDTSDEEIEQESLIEEPSPFQPHSILSNMTSTGNGNYYNFPSSKKKFEKLKQKKEELQSKDTSKQAKEDIETSTIIEVPKKKKIIELRDSKIQAPQPLLKSNIMGFCNLPVCVANFVHRKSDENEDWVHVIERGLSKEGGCNISGVIITGMGGIGKTQLSLFLAHHNKNKYNDYIRYVDAETPTSITKAFRSLLKVLLIDEDAVDSFGQEKIQEVLPRILPGIPRSLFVFDNVESESHIGPWLDIFSRHDMLITSRSMTWTKVNTFVHLNVFNPYEQQDVILFILKVINGTYHGDENRDSAQKLVLSQEIIKSAILCYSYSLLFSEKYYHKGQVDVRF